MIRPHNLSSMVQRMLFPVLFLFSASFSLKASDISTIDLYYDHLGGNNYLFTAKYVRDCGGPTAPASLVLWISSPTCGTQNTTLNLTGSPIEISPLCPSQLAQSNCNGGAYPGFETLTYTANFQFSQTCNDWTVYLDACCRNTQVTNLVNPGANSLYLGISLNNASGQINSSPRFSHPALVFWATGQFQCYNPGTYDLDGDSLSFSLANPQDGPSGAPIPYNPPYSATYPMGDVRAQLNFDPLNGNFCVKPDGQQAAQIKINIEEFRNGQLIGLYSREIQILVLSGINAVPKLSPFGIQNLQPGPTQVDSNSIIAHPGDTVYFEVLSLDTNAAQSLSLWSNKSDAIPGATYLASGANPITGLFSWIPTMGDIGYHILTLKAQDNACPVLGTQIFAFDIDILPLETGIIEEKNMTLSLKVFPNPFRDQIQISWKNLKETIEQIDFFDCQGRRIRIFSPEKGTNELTLPMQEQTPGIYFIRIRTERETTTTVKVFKF